MRTCEGVSEGKDSRSASPFPEQFPQPPLEEFNGCDPCEILNFCFGEIYWRQLNGNSRHGAVHNRKLSRQHGAYQLTLEILQLMSKNGSLGDPHPALHQEHIPRYLREVAYAQLDLGNIIGAQRSFEMLISATRGKDNEWDLLNYELDLVVALTAADNVDAAAKRLEHVERELDNLKGVGGQLEARQKTALERRVAARRGQILYLQGDYASAEKIYKQIEQRSEQSITRDVAHVYIATLGRSGRKANFSQAAKVCVKNIFENTSKGHHHEALGFRIAFGHLLRKLDLIEASEACLDQVYHDILQYGCSERTYLAFLLEAGRVVRNQGRFARAYGGYLRPCYDRAKFRGYGRFAETARQYCLDVLQSLTAGFNAVGNSEAWRLKLHDALSVRGDFVPASKLTGVDPLFSFGIGSVDSWVVRLVDGAALEREIQGLLEPGSKCV